MIALSELVMRVADQNPSLTRRVLLSQMRRQASALQRELEELLTRPGRGDHHHIQVARQRAVTIQQLLDALEQLVEGVPLDQIKVPEEALEVIYELNLATEPEGTPLSALDLPRRIQNALMWGLNRLGRTPSVEELVGLYNEKGTEGLLSFRNVGDKALKQTLDALRGKGYIE